MRMRTARPCPFIWRGARRKWASRSARLFWSVLAVAASVVVSSTACSGDRGGQRSTDASSSEAVIRITGSDTMVNLVQAWAENYKQVRPDGFRAGRRRRFRRGHRRPHRRDSRYRRRQSRDEGRRDVIARRHAMAQSPRNSRSPSMRSPSTSTRTTRSMSISHRRTRRDLRRTRTDREMVSTRRHESGLHERPDHPRGPPEQLRHVRLLS